MERDSAGGLCVFIQLKGLHLYMYKDWLFFLALLSLIAPWCLGED